MDKAVVPEVGMLAGMVVWDSSMEDQENSQGKEGGAESSKFSVPPQYSNQRSHSASPGGKW